jgi:hypothetical protein
MPHDFAEPRQQHDLAIGELKRAMIRVKHALVDLAKDRNGVVGIDTWQTKSEISRSAKLGQSRNLN